MANRREKRGLIQQGRMGWRTLRFYGFLMKKDALANSTDYIRSGHLWHLYPNLKFPLYFSRPGCGAAYLEISKNACSSVKVSMLKEDVPDDYSIHHTDARPDYYRRGLEDSDLFRFTFVRNPFDRLVSCYESKYHVDKDVYKKDHLDFDDYLDGYLAEDRGFEDFIHRIVHIPPRLMDRHFAPQSLYVYQKDGTPRVDFIGSYENMAEEYEPIREKYGFDPLPRYNVTNKPDWRDYYTLKTARMVHRKFRRDFRFFDYEESYRDLIAYLKKKGSR